MTRCKVIIVDRTRCILCKHVLTMNIHVRDTALLVLYKNQYIEYQDHNIVLNLTEVNIFMLDLHISIVALQDHHMNKLYCITIDYPHYQRESGIKKRNNHSDIFRVRHLAKHLKRNNGWKVLTVL